MSYLTRIAAVNAAARDGLPFMTYFDRSLNVWYFKQVILPLPVEVKALEALDFVHHVEWALSERGTLVPCAVVTCAADDVRMLEVPTGVKIEALDPSTWLTVTKYERPRSSVESPVAVVWRVANEMVGASRKEVIAACVALGVNPSTAATQYHKWGKAQA